jgi:hypothetical protein
MFGEDDLGKAHAYNYTNEGYKQIINVKENFTKLQSLTGASFECLIRIKGKSKELTIYSQQLKLLMIVISFFSLPKNRFLRLQ